MAVESETEEFHLPRHVAIIMDGNGRWAQARGMPRAFGHKQGAEAVRRVTQCASDMGLEYLTLFGFSSENWKRPEAEISDLMGLLRLYLRREVAELHKNNVRFRVIGNRDRLGPQISKLIESAEDTTAGNTGLTLTMAISYGGRDEIVSAVKNVASAVASGDLQIDDIVDDSVAQHLETKDIPDPDLLIRTSGEKRISNFLLWQCAYSEFLFTETLWPDFGHDELHSAIREFANRDRRYGAAVG